jgi:hypothetical protein
MKTSENARHKSDSEKRKKNNHATYFLTLLILLLPIHYDADNVFELTANNWEN